MTGRRSTGPKRIVEPGSYHSVWKELKNAERLGIAVSSRMGRMVRYQVNPASWLAVDLTPLFRRTSEASAVAEAASPTYVTAPIGERVAASNVEAGPADTCTSGPAGTYQSGLDTPPGFEGQARLAAKREEILRGDAVPDSDIDFLVDLEPGRSLLDLGGLHAELEHVLGRPVDVATETGLRGRIRDRVLKEAIPL